MKEKLEELIRDAKKRPLNVIKYTGASAISAISSYSGGAYYSSFLLEQNFTSLENSIYSLVVRNGIFFLTSVALYTSFFINEYKETSFDYWRKDMNKKNYANLVGCLGNLVSIPIQFILMEKKFDATYSFLVSNLIGGLCGTFLTTYIDAKNKLITR
ncbi:MAG: hypothetical protein QW273_02190 [Candidatus Pacearchaeota archaeon]